MAGVYEENAGLSTCGPRRRNAAKPRARLSGEGRNPEKRRLDPGLRRDDGAAIEPLTGHTYPVKPALTLVIQSPSARLSMTFCNYQSDRALNSAAPSLHPSSVWAQIEDGNILGGRGVTHLKRSPVQRPAG